MFEKIKLIVAILGGVFFILGLIISRLGFLFKFGFILIGLWAFLTVISWKNNERSENWIAVVIMLAGLGFLGFTYGGRILQML